MGAHATYGLTSRVKKQYVRLFTFFLYVSLGWVLCGQNAFAQQPSASGNVFSPVLSYSLLSLTSSYDGRASAIGGAGVSTMADAASPYINPGKTPFHTKKYGVSISYSPLLFDVVGFSIHAAVAQGFYNFGKKTNTGTNNTNSVYGGFHFLNYGEVQATTATGDVVSTYNPNQFSAFIGYTRKIGKFGIGLSIQGVNQDLVPNSLRATYAAASARQENKFVLSGNLGIFFSSGDMLALTQGEIDKAIFNAGLTIKNVGPKIEYQSISSFQPTTISLGASVVHEAGSNFILQHTIEINKLLVPFVPAGATQESIDNILEQSIFDSYSNALQNFLSSFEVRGGIEVYIMPAKLFARVGASYSYEQYFTNNGGITFSGGLGYKYEQYGINIAYQYAAWSLAQSSVFLTVFWDIGGYLETKKEETFNLDFFSVEDLFPELE